MKDTTVQEKTLLDGDVGSREKELVDLLRSPRNNDSSTSLVLIDDISTDSDCEGCEDEDIAQQKLKHPLKSMHDTSEKGTEGREQRSEQIEDGAQDVLDEGDEGGDDGGDGVGDGGDQGAEGGGYGGHFLRGLVGFWELVGFRWWFELLIELVVELVDECLEYVSSRTNFVFPFISP